MITEDDARRTIDMGKYYVIQPEFPWWKEEYSNGGKSLKDGFSYVSDINEYWLSVNDLRELVNSSKGVH